MSKNSIYRVQSIERAFLILEEISRRKSGVRVTDLAANLSIPLPTVHRIVSFLEHKGYLEQDPETKRYHLGLKILELQGLFINRFSLVDRALPELKRIAYGLGETVHLGVLSDGYVVYIESLEGANSMISKATIGSRAPVHSTALGKVLLAWRSWSEVQDILRTRGMEKDTPNTIDNEAAFRVELEKVREQGYALDCNERSMVSHCVAVPIWNYRKEVEAAVSISVASHTFSPERKEVLVAYLQNVSQAVSLGQTAIG